MQSVYSFGKLSGSLTRSFATSKGKSVIFRLPRLSAATQSEQSVDGGSFFAEAASFAELGLSQPLEAAIQAKGFKRPSRVQEMTIPQLIEGKTAVIAAETGSGKTLAYLAPIINNLLRHKEKLKQDPEELGRSYALVLCPNIQLCHQVLALSQSLTGSNGKAPLVSAAHINASNPPPQQTPDIIISTPAAILSFINEAGPQYGWIWSGEGLSLRVRHVVFDEADLLLGRAFEKPVTQLLQLFRSSDRRRVEAKMFQELGIDKADFDRLPRPMQQAGWRKGSLGLMEAGYRVPGGWASKGDPSTFGPYWRRQYIFCAATMPSVTMSDVGSEIERMFPTVEWISSELLHQSNTLVEHSWLQVDDSSFKNVLLRAVREDPDFLRGRAKTLIFAESTAAADELSLMLQEEDLDHFVFHKNIPMPERTAALEAMSSPSTSAGNKVMVCTDAASRGLDIANITHVVQADFAPNAVDFIHRIGRTGRAGRAGRVTSLYRKQGGALAEVLKQYVDEGRPLEAAFSRARSFSRKIKRRGEFIPRGYSKSQLEEEQAKDHEA